MCWSLFLLQRVGELQEVMEEYLKRCRINLSDRDKLIQDAVRLEGQLSLSLTQLKTCLLGGDCDSRSLRHWASAAAFHTQMLVHLAGLEGGGAPRAARAALEQYQEDLTQIIPAYRRYKSNTVCVVKCRGGLSASCDPSNEMPEEGSMTGLTVTDRETGRSVTLPLSTLETEAGRRRRADGSSVTSSMNLDLITSDQYAQAYLERLFSDEGPVAELQSYFNRTSEHLLTSQPGSTDQPGGGGHEEEGGDGRRPTEPAEGGHVEQRVDRARGDKQDETERRGRGRGEEMKELDQRDESLQLSIRETQPEESLYQGASST
ncbi:uncharacterized protein LOC128453059 [Pleuronectes platessa]|uniref:uncharacterized protein LOC128453059 n=1 Tax=Pleuronectes platessa TaxID=8262 RepID=UPI00232A21BB|nr:uncharacterized protein LOC128453059 [Pleuronectes platessa]